MKIKFLKSCRDRETGERYNVGNIREFGDARALEIIGNEGNYAAEYAEDMPETAKPISAPPHDDGIQVDDPQSEASDVSAALDITEIVENMTIPQLKQFAEDNGIDLTGLRSKADILTKIKEAK